MTKRHEWITQRLREHEVIDTPLGQSVLQLSETFSKQNHTEQSAKDTLDLFVLLMEHFDYENNN